MQDGSGLKLNGELPQRSIQHVLQADNYDAGLRARSADLRAPGRRLRDLPAKSGAWHAEELTSEAHLTGGAIVGEWALHKTFDQIWENANKGKLAHHQAWFKKE